MKNIFALLITTVSIYCFASAREVREDVFEATWTEGIYVRSMVFETYDVWPFFLEWASNMAGRLDVIEADDYGHDEYLVTPEKPHTRALRHGEGDG